MKNCIIQVLCSSPYGCSEFINVMVPFVESLGSAPLVSSRWHGDLLAKIPGENRILSRAVTGYGFWDLISRTYVTFTNIMLGIAHCVIYA